MGRPFAALAVTCTSLALLAAGCGQSKLDTSKLEDQIEKTLADRTGFTISEVNCPDDIEAKKGGTFRCTVTTERGEHAVANVTQTDGKGGVTWKLAGPLKR